MTWQPSESVVSHAGTPLEPQQVFFSAPPEEIGEVQSAWTTLPAGKRPLGLTVRLAIACGMLVGTPILMIGVARAGGLNAVDRSSLALLGVLVGMLLAAVALLLTRFHHTCTFVGAAGMSRHLLKGTLESPPRDEVFLFDDATDLYTSQTRHYTNGVYTGTTYSYDWKDHRGERRFKLSGTYRSKEGNPKPKDPFHFAQAGEIAWSNYLLDILQDELEQHGTIEFKVNKRDCVRIGPGFLEFDFKGMTQRVESEQIRTLQVSGGSFQIDTHDARWFGRKGKFRFDYGAMANARVFLMALETLGGLSFGDETETD